MSLSLNQITFSIPAGQTQEFGLVADFYRLATFPSGLLVSVNGGPAIALAEGFSQQGTPGSGEVRLLRIENPTAGLLAGVFTHGTGQMSLPGVTTLSGTFPLPSGASTAALQTNQLGALTSLISIASTADLQAEGNAHLQTLANPSARYPRVVAFTAGAAVVITNARQIDIFNTHATIAVSVQIPTQPNFSLAAGYGLGWPLLGPRDTSYPSVTVDVPASGTGFIVYTL